MNRTECEEAINEICKMCFDTKTKSIYSELIDGEYGSPEPIVLTFELFSAITQQVKELNW